MPRSPGSASCAGICLRASLPGSTCATTHRLASHFPSPPSLKQPTGGTGFFTGLPSPTPFSLSLGPDSPWADSPCPRNPENFGERVSHPFSRYSCRQLHFCALHVGSRLPFSAHRTLPYQRSRNLSAASVICFSPPIFSAQTHLTSELLRFLSRMAASKPTSWLSGHIHILLHLTDR